MEHKVISATDELLCNLIDNAAHKISFMATGINKKIADALIRKKDIVQCVILCNQENTYMAGYGDTKGLFDLSSEGITIYSVKNILINILGVDDTAVIYSPTPLVIEESPNGTVPNGILTDFSSVESLFLKTYIASDEEFLKMNSLNHTVSHGADKGSSIVIKPLTKPEIINTIEKVRDKVPQFDISRQLNTYKANIQFVELELVGFKYKSRKIKVPDDLFLLANDDVALKNKLAATCTLFSGDGKWQSALDEISDEVDKLRKEFTTSVLGYGTVFDLSRKKDFNEAIENVKKAIQSLQKISENDVANEYNKTIEALTKILLPMVLQNPSKKVLNDLGIYVSVEEKVKNYIEQRLAKAFKSPKNYISQMGLTVNYKDLTYETLKDQKFREAFFKTELGKQFQEKGILSEEKAMVEKKLS